MDCYQKMYTTLCIAVSDALDVLPVHIKTLHARLILEKSLQDAEEILLEHMEKYPDFSDRYEH